MSVLNGDRRAEVETVIRACLVAHKGAVLVHELNKDYEEQEGEPIPYRDFNCKTLIQFLLQLKHVLTIETINGSTYLRPVDSEKSRHVISLVKGQKSAKRSINKHKRIPSSRSQRYQRFLPRETRAYGNLSYSIRRIRPETHHSKSSIYVPPRFQVPSHSSHSYSRPTYKSSTMREITKEGIPVRFTGEDDDFNTVNARFQPAGCIYRPCTSTLLKKNVSIDQQQQQSFSQSHDHRLLNNQTRWNSHREYSSCDQSSVGHQNSVSGLREFQTEKNHQNSRHCQNVSDNKNLKNDEESCATQNHHSEQIGSWNNENHHVLNNYDDEANFDSDEEFYEEISCGESRLGIDTHQGDWQEESFDQNELSLVINKKVQARLLFLIRDNPDGIWCADLPKKYEQAYNISLDYLNSGFGSVIEFASQLPKIFHCVRPTDDGDFILYNAEKPLPTLKRSPPVRSTLASLHNIYGDQEEDPEVFPGKLDPETTTKLIPEGVMDIKETVGYISVTTLGRADDFEEVIVSEVFTPSFFWIQLRKKVPKFIKFMNELHTFYEANHSKYKVPLIMLEKGLNVACIYDEKWHRGIIKSVLPNGDSNIHFYDYGTVKTYPQQKLYYLHRKFSNLPAQAIPCGLFNVKPYQSNRWSKDVTREFARKVQVPLIATIASRDEKNNSMLLSLADTRGDEDFHINDWMHEMNLAEKGYMVGIMGKNFLFSYHVECSREKGYDPFAPDFNLEISVGEYKKLNFVKTITEDIETFSKSKTMAPSSCLRIAEKIENPLAQTKKSKSATDNKYVSVNVEEFSTIESNSSSCQVKRPGELPTRLYQKQTRIPNSMKVENSSSSGCMRSSDSLKGGSLPLKSKAPNKSVSRIKRLSDFMLQQKAVGIENDLMKRFILQERSENSQTDNDSSVNPLVKNNDPDSGDSAEGVSQNLTFEETNLDSPSFVSGSTDSDPVPQHSPLLLKEKPEQKTEMTYFGNFRSECGGNGRMEPIDWKAIRASMQGDKCLLSMPEIKNNSRVQGPSLDLIREDLPPVNPGILSIISNDLNSAKYEGNVKWLPENNITYSKCQISPLLKLQQRILANSDKQISILISSKLANILKGDVRELRRTSDGLVDPQFTTDMNTSKISTIIQFPVDNKKRAVNGEDIRELDVVSERDAVIKEKKSEVGAFKVVINTSMSNLPEETRLTSSEITLIKRIPKSSFPVTFLRENEETFVSSPETNLEIHGPSLEQLQVNPISSEEVKNNPVPLSEEPQLIPFLPEKVQETPVPPLPEKSQIMNISSDLVLHTSALHELKIGSKKTSSLDMFERLKSFSGSVGSLDSDDISDNQDSDETSTNFGPIEIEIQANKFESFVKEKIPSSGTNIDEVSSNGESPCENVREFEEIDDEIESDQVPSLGSDTHISPSLKDILSEVGGELCSEREKSLDIPIPPKETSSVVPDIMELVFDDCNISTDGEEFDIVNPFEDDNQRIYQRNNQLSTVSDVYLKEITSDNAKSQIDESDDCGSAIEIVAAEKISIVPPNFNYSDDMKLPEHRKDPFALEKSRMMDQSDQKEFINFEYKSETKPLIRRCNSDVSIGGSDISAQKYAPTIDSQDFLIIPEGIIKSVDEWEPPGKSKSSKNLLMKMLQQKFDSSFDLDF